MIDDKETLLSDHQAITVSAASTNKYDAGVVDLGRGNAPFVHVRCEESVTAAGAAAVTFLLQTDDAADFAAPVTLATTRAIAKGELVAGQDVFATFVPEGAERYLRVYYTVANGPLTAGKFSARLGGRQIDGATKHYPRAASARV